MLSISCDDMRAIDNYAINSIGIPSIILMENAALRVIDNIDLDRINSFAIICGVGNNGGDGLAIARHLILINKEVRLFIIGNPDKGTRDFNTNLNILDNMDVHYDWLSDYSSLNKLQVAIHSSDLTIDSIFGVGLTRDIEGLFHQTIELINQYSNKILSVDIPSGLDGDTGKILAISVKANRTVTFHLAKRGLLANNNCAGQIIVEDIGIPKKVTDIILKQ